jgi:hypothetical protein
MRRREESPAASRIKSFLHLSPLIPYLRIVCCGSSGVAFGNYKGPGDIRVLTGEDYHAYAVRVDVLAFGSARGSRDRVGARRHSVRYEVRAAGRGRRLDENRTTRVLPNPDNSCATDKLRIFDLFFRRRIW